MTELRVMAVTSDGQRLVLRSNDGQEFHLTIDERLRAAVRGDRARLGQIEIEAEGQLRPRDIQSRIRAGATAQEVADACGISVERIRRFEGPILAERAFMAEKAQNTQVRRQGENHGQKLGEIVGERLAKRGAEDPAAVHWDSWRRDDGTWTVQAIYKISGETYEALWAFDPPRRLVTPEDDEARLLSSDASSIAAAEPMFPFAAASVLSGGTVLPGPAPSTNGSSAGGALVHLEARRRPAESSANGSGGALERERERDRDRERTAAERTASVERHPSSMPASAAASASASASAAAAANGTAGVPSPANSPEEDFDFLDAADTRSPAPIAAVAGQSAGSAFDDAIFGPRTTVPHRERMVGTTDRQAEADGVRPGRRATVPSWDEIVFGSRRGKQKGRD
ncbi:septation protein SepH [Catenulispora pinisilvae]|uniref:septation protein SepH n=1 Tax=Catenulispora pinisilvae TaxID=2705253 RepID=UPI001892213A|nr:septation protein SepH [Catenulispora pinisilvae]